MLRCRTAATTNYGSAHVDTLFYDPGKLFRTHGVVGELILTN